MRGRPGLEVGEISEIRIVEVKPATFQADGRIRGDDGRVIRSRVRRSSRAAAKRAVVAKLQELAALEQGGDVTAVSTLDELADAWVGQLDVSMNSRRIYKSTLDLHVLPALGGLRVRELTTPRAERFLNGLTGHATRKTCRAVLSGMCSMAVRWGIMPRNPIRETSAGKSERKPVKAMDLEQVQALRDAMTAFAGANATGPARAVWLPWLVDFMLGTGVRIGEALAMRWEDVGLGGERPTAAVTGTLVFEKGRGCYRQEWPKSTSGYRVLQLPPIAVTALINQRDENGAGQTDWCFPSIYGNAIPLSSAQRALRGARPKELEWVTFHTIRKTVATMIANEQGADAAMVQLGHADLRITQQHYLQRPELGPNVTDLLSYPRPESA